MNKLHPSDPRNSGAKQAYAWLLRHGGTQTAAAARFGIRQATLSKYIARQASK